MDTAQLRALSPFHHCPSTFLSHVPSALSCSHRKISQHQCRYWTVKHDFQITLNPLRHHALCPPAPKDLTTTTFRSRPRSIRSQRPTTNPPTRQLCRPRRSHTLPTHPLPQPLYSLKAFLRRSSPQPHNPHRHRSRPLKYVRRLHVHDPQQPRRLRPPPQLPDLLYQHIHLHTPNRPLPHLLVLSPRTTPRPQTPSRYQLHLVPHSPRPNNHPLPLNPQPHPLQPLCPNAERHPRRPSRQRNPHLLAPHSQHSASHPLPRHG